MQMHDKYIEIKIDGKIKKFYYIWLRDNCRCEKCYIAVFNQFTSVIFKIPTTIKPKNCKITTEKLIILWEDEHSSEYLLKWLNSFEFEYKAKIERFLWGQNIEKVMHDVVVPADHYFANTNGVKTLVGKVLKYGFGIVSGVHPTIEATEKVVRRLGPIHRTCFGEMWHVRPDSDYSDTASTKMSLLPHNDNTYFTNPAGLQIFHMLEHDGEGGETILVDGFNLAKIIKNKSLEAFETLCTVPVESCYIDKKSHYMCTDTILKLHPVTKELHHVRFNIYDRAPLTSVKDENILKFYEALTMIGKEVNDSRNQYCFKLQPGSVIFIDNWRVLHGRVAYTGLRDIGGCYVSRDDFISAAKKFYPELQ